MSFWDLLLKIWVVVLLIGTAIPFMREQIWWLRAWTYARLQMLALLIVTSVSFWLLTGLSSALDVSLFIAMVLAALSCLWDIMPFTKLGPKQTPAATPEDTQIDIRLMVGNVLMDNDKFDEYLAQINEVSPDILFLVETDETWRKALSDLEEKYPHRYLLPLPDYNGMLFYSRYPVLKVQERYLIQDYIPSLTMELDVGHTQALRFYGVHPRPPRPEDDTSNLDAELGFVANEAGHLDGPTIVTGDLNDVGWSSTTKKFLRVSGLKDPRHGRGLYNSYNAKNPLVRWPLDHVFHSKHFGLVEMKRLKPCGSDHFPLLIHLALSDPAKNNEVRN